MDALRKYLGSLEGRPLKRFRYLGYYDDAKVFKSSDGDLVLIGEDLLDEAHRILGRNVEYLGPGADMPLFIKKKGSEEAVVIAPRTRDEYFSEEKVVKG